MPSPSAQAGQGVRHALLSSTAAFMTAVANPQIQPYNLYFNFVMTWAWLGSFTVNYRSWFETLHMVTMVTACHVCTSVSVLPVCLLKGAVRHVVCVQCDVCARHMHLTPSSGFLIRSELKLNPQFLPHQAHSCRGASVALCPVQPIVQDDHSTGPS